MKTIQWITVVLFALVILVPLAAFRWEPGVASEIDNRMLAENPFSPGAREKGGDLTEDIESFVNDRIGFRDEMILAYEVLNDKLFQQMVHPSYTYGQDGYVFTKIGDNRTYGDFERTFADMVVKIRDYCAERSVPFLFVLNPSKKTVLSEYLPTGVHYDDGWADELLASMEERGVRCVDNRKTLQAAYEAGETVFNQKYDAVHWNDWGAFYGCAAILEALRETCPGAHVTSREELTVSQTLKTSLPGAKFPIHEYVPALSVPLSVENLRELYADEVPRSAAHAGFGYFVNARKLAEGAPRALVFQGSYMNVLGAKYMMNGLGEYVYIHGYDNTMDFSDYYQMFRPECVIVEVAEHALGEEYYNMERMLAVDLNPTLVSARAAAEWTEELTLPPESVSVERGKALTKLIWTCADGAEEYAWALLGGEEYDLRRDEGGSFSVLVKNEVWDEGGSSLELAAREGGVLRLYR